VPPNQSLFSWNAIADGYPIFPGVPHGDGSTPIEGAGPQLNVIVSTLHSVGLVLNTLRGALSGHTLNAITWFSVNRDLLIGTLNEEFLVKSSDGRALSNTNISILSQTGYGSKRIKPLSLETIIIVGTSDHINVIIC
jgi:hypothetical protein